jgi:hypothetical protein
MQAVLDPVRFGPPLGDAVVLNRDSQQAVGIVACWPMFASAGAGILRDLAGVYPGTLNGALTWTTGLPHGPALSFPEATTAYVDCGSAPVLDNMPSVGMTLAIWCRITPTGGTGANRTLASKSDAAGDGWRLVLSPADERLYWVTMDSGAVGRESSGPAMSAGDVLVVVTVAPSTLQRLYVNGAEVVYNTQATTGATYGGDAANNVELGRLGQGTGFWPWHSLIYEARLYNRVLGPAEVWQLYDPATRWHLYAPTRRLWAVITGQFARPIADVSDGGWTNELGNNTDLYASIDESSPSDSDYIQSSVDPVDDTVKFDLDDVGTPAVNTGHIIRIRMRRA